jgi:transcription-repair coupling factor (superfamily II helicase)
MNFEKPMLSEVISTIRSQVAFKEIEQSIQSGDILPNLSLSRAARLPVLAALHQTSDAPILLLTDRTDYALTLVDELSIWASESSLLFFPEPNPLFYESAPWGVTTRRDRLLGLITLASAQIPGVKKQTNPPIIIAPARAIMSRTLPRHTFIKATRTIKVGQIIQPDQLVRNWVSLGYQVENTVIAVGQFARRGGILDIWPANSNYPTRLEFFGDEIDTLRHFNPSTQRTIDSHELVLIPPAREYLQKEGFQYDLPENNEISEFHIPLLHPAPASILDYLPNNALVIIDNHVAFQETINEIEEQSLSLRQDSIEDGSISEDFPIPYLTWDQIQDSLPPERTLIFGPMMGLTEDVQTHQSLGEHFSPNPRFGGQLKSVLEHLSQVAKGGDQIVIVSRQAKRLKELWDDYYKPISSPSISPVFSKGSLSDGWVLSTDEQPNIYLLTDGEIFGWQQPRPRKRPRPVAEAPEAPYADLNPGDWVVHIDHGVGNFTGLVRRTIDGAEREYLRVEYAESDQLFVPVHQVDRLTRYVGTSSREPTRTRLGGSQWRNVKEKVKKAVEYMAEELLDLYAKRNIVQGYAFSADTPWQHDLEASFSYLETEDQLRVLEDVKRDMEAPEPMDRLICGDVGYGKTEIALRAAFKAVMDGKQVALLVPTTVLAQQHFHTFRDRLAAFPVEVEMLSRFRSPQQQRNILFRLSQGVVDIIIGTHRILSGDVEFKDLGLLIIDEEQRFGVTHKESLKKLRTEVDVLTMTATPIPRTLYMTLTGVRDISTITTPPEERLPIITHVGPYSERLVRRAILRELERGGQVFFVHNRVQTIGAMRNHLARLVPEARIGVAHGQMQENLLSRRMDEFTDAEIDILLSTSIIESGLDIPNANTLIVDRADTFGLAQLYQLRGRVGRGAQRAYAYFFKHKQRTPTHDGRQRLETLAENTQLGAGFTIAMRDLEIRGAGDILGARQHGHIAAVGFHLYTRLLAEAVKQMRDNRGLPMDRSALAMRTFQPLVSVDLPFHTNIPTDYVPDRTMRLGLYRRIADVQTLDEIDALASEFPDRFGPPPKQVENLFFQMRVKILATQAGFSNVSIENGQIILRYLKGIPQAHEQVSDPRIRVGKTALWVRLPSETEEWSTLLVEVLTQYAKLNSEHNLNPSPV